MCKEGLENEDQLKFLDEVVKEMDKRRKNPHEYEGKALMLDAPAGYGKTFLLETIHAYGNMEKNEDLVLCSAFSGININKTIFIFE